MKKLLEFLRELYAPKTNAPEANLSTLSLILYINKPQTRLQKREYDKECKKVTEQIKPLEDQYLNDLFNDDLQNDAYSHYLNAFTFKAKMLNKTFKYIKVNEYYFSELYHK
jgi:hypothetical protein